METDLYDLVGVSPEAPPERIDATFEVQAAEARILQYASDPQMAAEARNTLILTGSVRDRNGRPLA